MSEREPTRQELASLHAWEALDEVPGKPEMTAFRRRARLLQARWRVSQGHPIGTQPIQPRDGAAARDVGSRLPLVYARETGANFLTPGAREAARARTARREPNQSLDHQRLWADLLWSPALAFNLFGDLYADHELADRAVHRLWPEMPAATVDDVKFVHSPGWLDPAYLRSLRAFDTAFVLALRDGGRGIVGIDVKYHERAKAETPKPENLTRYLAVAERSSAFLPGAVDAVKGRSELALIWLEHLLLLSMLQHPTDGWRWGRYVVVYPARNTDMAGLCSTYRALLADDQTFTSMTLEQLLQAEALPESTVALLRERYLTPV